MGFGFHPCVLVRFSFLQRGGTRVSDPRQLCLRAARGAAAQSSHEAAHSDLQGGVAGWPLKGWSTGGWRAGRLGFSDFFRRVSDFLGEAVLKSLKSYVGLFGSGFGVLNGGGNGARELRGMDLDHCCEHGPLSLSWQSCTSISDRNHPVKLASPQTNRFFAPNNH